MKRRITYLVFFILLGAIINVAVAWGCVYFPQKHKIRSERTVTTEERQFLFDRLIRGESCRTPSWVTQKWDINKVKWGDFEDEGTVWVYTSTGYKEELLMTSISYEYETSSSTFFGGSSSISVGGSDRLDGFYISAGYPILAMSTFVCDIPDKDNRFYPYDPIWPGFAINTLIYAVIVGILWSIPFTMRRIIRRKRGACLKCGYDLRHADHKVCPECGCKCINLAK